MEHYPPQTGVDFEDVVARAVDFSRHQDMSTPRDCIVCYGALPTRDISRDTTEVEFSNWSNVDTFSVPHSMVVRFVTEHLFSEIQNRPVSSN